jgi:20S proteasome subunit alpha 2
MVNAKTFLEKRYNDEMELEDAIHTAILTLKEGFEGQISETNIEIGIVNDQRKFRVCPLMPRTYFLALITLWLRQVLTPAEILDYLGEVE